MFDARARRLLQPIMDRTAQLFVSRGVGADALTAGGLVTGLLGALAAGFSMWSWALALWLTSRVLDGLDGAVARASQQERGSAVGAEPLAPASAAGGYVDIMADFTVYAAFVVGVAIGWGGSLAPFLAVLAAYYVNGAAFLAFSSAAERTGRTIDDGRSLSFIGGLAEGAETIAVHSLWCLFPAAAGPIAWVWAGVVGVSAVQRTWDGWRRLR